jgi:predicted  nucleic acid-binding Zn-ribbon protein
MNMNKKDLITKLMNLSRDASQASKRISAAKDELEDAENDADCISSDLSDLSKKVEDLEVDSKAREALEACVEKISQVQMLMSELEAIVADARRE